MRPNGDVLVPLPSPSGATNHSTASVGAEAQAQKSKARSAGCKILRAFMLKATTGAPANDEPALLKIPDRCDGGWPATCFELFFTQSMKGDKGGASRSGVEKAGAVGGALPTTSAEFFWRWGLVTAAAAVILSTIDALLLQRARSFFTGGFLSVDHLAGPRDVAAFL